MKKHNSFHNFLKHSMKFRQNDKQTNIESKSNQIERFFATITGNVVMMTRGV